MEQGRLALSDDISKYLPDYPMQGRRVSIEQLLTHTSGIRNYTHMEAWFPHQREDWTVEQIIATFRNEPFDFEPGTKWSYDNSGYILLGAILEKVTGKKYADLVSEWIFQPLGMKDTRYGSDTPIVPRRADGYQKGPDGIINAPFLSMTQPFSAGALVSTVDDLARWQAAIDAGKVLSPESLRKWWTPVTLPDGTKTRYGFAWVIGTYEGHPVIEHGGAVNGFATANMRLPDDHLYVAVLSNCGGCADVRFLALTAAGILIGKPLDARKTVALSPALLDAYAGAYTDSDGDDWVVRRKNDHLEVQAGRFTWDAFATSADGFLLQNSVWTIRFVKGDGGAVTAMEIDQGTGPVDQAGRKRDSTGP